MVKMIKLLFIFRQAELENRNISNKLLEEKINMINHDMLENTSNFQTQVATSMQSIIDLLYFICYLAISDSRFKRQTAR